MTMTMTSRTYYTIAELSAITLNKKWNEATKLVFNLVLIMTFLNATPSADIATAIGDDNSLSMFDVFIHKHWNEYICYSDIETDEYGNVISSETENDAMADWCERACSYFYRTLAKHKAVLTAYASKSATLMAQIASTNKLLNNDMPVSAVDTANHLSALTESDSSEDGATAMARLDEVQRLYKDELDQWEEDFASQFTIENVN